MVHDKKDVRPIVIDDRVVLPTRENMDPEMRKTMDRAYELVAEELGWERRKPSQG